ncbi:MAG: hypothetical protein BWY79_02179 [Actinobacteria bacterium ADurb.Bin444]|nr:MAG: hypothetical protein BWY79_02179 [Actinobacteria bacterium ADurb.Bin444]
MVLLERLKRRRRVETLLREMPVGDDPAQVGVASGVPRQQCDVMSAFQRHLGTSDGADAGIRAGLVELHRSRQVVVVGHGEGRHAHRGGSLGQVADPRRAIEKRKRRMDVQVNKGHRGSPWPKTGDSHLFLESMK